MHSWRFDSLDHVPRAWTAHIHFSFRCDRMVKFNPIVRLRFISRIRGIQQTGDDHVFSHGRPRSTCGGYLSIGFQGTLTQPHQPSLESKKRVIGNETDRHHRCTETTTNAKAGVFFPLFARNSILTVAISELKDRRVSQKLRAKLSRAAAVKI